MTNFAGPKTTPVGIFVSFLGKGGISSIITSSDVTSEISVSFVTTSKGIVISKII